VTRVVGVGYSIRVTGFDAIPAMGSATAYIDTYLQEAHTGDNGKAANFPTPRGSSQQAIITEFTKYLLSGQTHEVSEARRTTEFGNPKLHSFY
jgi:hypothetical protein